MPPPDKPSRQTTAKPTLPGTYLDYAAASPMLEEVLDAHAELARTWVVNPHGTSCFAELAKREIAKAEALLLDRLQIPAAEARVVWTAGGTEADNIACRGTPMPIQRANTILVDSGAHDAMREACTFRARRRAALCVDIPLTREGALHLQGVDLPRTSTGIALVAVTHVNNETGAVCDLRELRDWMNTNAPHALLAVDAIQSVGKMPIPWQDARIDLLTLSARKIGGPNSVGAVIHRPGIALSPVLVGGSQQNGVRPGTLDVPGILECVLATAIVTRRMEASMRNLANLNHFLRQQVLNLRQFRPVIVSPPDACPAICTVAFPGYEGAILMRLLAEQGILVSAGSACHAESGQVSHVLKAMGIPDRTARGALRVSLAPNTTYDNLTHFLDQLATTLASY